LESIVEFRWHGRGGQGTWTASNLLAYAALDEGKYIQSFPEFGTERMGAPVTAYTRISIQPIRLHCAVNNPNVVVVLDNTLLKSEFVTDGLNPTEGCLIINSNEKPSVLKKSLGITGMKVWAVPATDIALRFLGVPITNTALLGAVAKATNIVSLENIQKTLKTRFKPDLVQKNVAAVNEAYEIATTEE